MLYNKVYLTWGDYDDGMEQIHNYILDTVGEDTSKVHIVGIYRGSLLMGSHLSNVLDAPMSIVKFQTRDGDDKSPYFIYDAGIKDDDYVFIVDDIYDTGLTMNKVVDFVNHKNTYTLTLVEKPNSENDYGFLENTDDEWFVFPWEVIV